MPTPLLLVFLAATMFYGAVGGRPVQLYKNAAIYLYGSTLSCSQPDNRLHSTIQLLCAGRYSPGEGNLAHIVRYACVNAKTFRFNIFQIQAETGPYVYLQMVDSGLCVDNLFGFPGESISQWDCGASDIHPNINQLFTFQSVGLTPPGCPSEGYDVVRIVYHPQTNVYPWLNPVLSNVTSCLTTGPEHLQNQACLPDADALDPTQTFLVLDNQPFID